MCTPGQPPAGPAAPGFPAAPGPASTGFPASTVFPGTGLPGSAGLPSSTGEALVVLEGALAFLAAADAAALSAGEQADVLRGLERAESARTAARSSVLAAFTAARGFEADGQASARAWLAWQTRVTGGAAAAATGWARRLTAHPAIRAALAAGTLTASWARQACDWSDVLPPAARPAADVILVTAAAGGAALADLGALAEEILRRTAAADPDTGDGAGAGNGAGDGTGAGGGDDGFGDRSVRLGTTFRGAGRLDGDLTPQCAAAVRAVLDALGAKAGPEDTRTGRQRDHDALEEACRRLIAAGFIPDRAGQPTQIQLIMTLEQLRDQDPGHAAETTWTRDAASYPGDPATSPGTGSDAGAGSDAGEGTAAAAATAASTGGTGTAAAAGAAGPWWPGCAPAGPGADCDAAIAPAVTGTIDPDVLDQLTAALLGDPDTPPASTPAGHGAAPQATAGQGTPVHGAADQAGAGQGTADQAAPGQGTAPQDAADPATADQDAEGRATADQDAEGQDAADRAGERRRRAQRAARALIISRAADLLSGPSGLTALLRQNLPGAPTAVTSRSLPLDVGAATQTIPGHLRRAVTLRDRHCRFPGCDQPPAACQPHHILPRAQGGTTSLTNLMLLCSFHHLIAVHRWGWAITLHPDTTVTATSPDGKRTHGPPPAPQAPHAQAA